MKAFSKVPHKNDGVNKDTRGNKGLHKQKIPHLERNSRSPHEGKKEGKHCGKAIEQQVQRDVPEQNI